MKEIQEIFMKISQNLDEFCIEYLKNGDKRKIIPTCFKHTILPTAINSDGVL
jgi:hypothetical protein